MVHEELSRASGAVHASARLEAMDDEALHTAILRQRDAVAAGERALAEARNHADQLRRHLRDLEAEQERRRMGAQGSISAPAEPKPARRKRSTTGMDALLGRDGVDPEWPFARFRLLSLQRQEVYLNHTGDRAQQILGFVDPTTGGLHEAHTFGEARRFQEQGYVLGWPGVPLQRQAVWYVVEGKPGWLRLDQLFVERDVEDD